MNKNRYIAAVTAVGLFSAAGLAIAQQGYPSKPIRIIAPFAAGSGTDFVARLVAERLVEPLGQQVIVDTRPGAGGTIGTEMGVKSPPDGYTFVLVSAGYPVSPAFYRFNYDPVQDITAVVLISKGPILIACHPSLPARSMKDLLAIAKSRPGAVNYGSAGQGSMAHMAAELLQYLSHAKLNHIPYKGSGPATIDVVAGHAEVLFGNVSGTLPHVRSGRLRGLAVTTPEHIAADPQIPTVAESGVAGYEVTSWQGLIGPKGIPRTIVDRINIEITRAIRQKSMEDRLQSDGMTAAGGAPEQFQQQIRKEIELWKKVVTAADLKLQ